MQQQSRLNFNYSGVQSLEIFISMQKSTQKILEK